MTAWLVITAHVHDRDAFLAGYGPAAARLVEAFGGRYVIRAPGGICLEGTRANGASVVVSEWPSRAAALAFWHSPQYAEVRKLRDGLADVEVVLVGE